MRGKAQMRHQHQRAISGMDETTRSVRHLAPAAALLMVRKFLNHPAARETIRHGQARQLAAEQLALNVEAKSQQLRVCQAKGSPIKGARNSFLFMETGV
jgi:hypothetical protein